MHQHYDEHFGCLTQTSSGTGQQMSAGTFNKIGFYMTSMWIRLQMFVGVPY